MPDPPEYYHDPAGRKQRERERRIDELMAAAGGQGTALGREFWALVHDHEEAPVTTDIEELRAAGFELPPAASMDDETLRAKLADLVGELERMHVQLVEADHLTERELYELLVEDLLHEEREDIPMPEGGVWILDVSLARPLPEDLADLDDPDRPEHVPR